MIKSLTITCWPWWDSDGLSWPWNCRYNFVLMWIWESVCHFHQFPKVACGQKKYKIHWSKGFLDWDSEVANWRKTFLYPYFPQFFKDSFEPGVVHVSEVSLTLYPGRGWKHWWDGWRQQNLMMAEGGLQAPKLKGSSGRKISSNFESSPSLSQLVEPRGEGSWIFCGCEDQVMNDMLGTIIDPVQKSESFSNCMHLGKTLNLWRSHFLLSRLIFGLMAQECIILSLGF